MSEANDEDLPIPRGRLAMSEVLRRHLAVAGIECGKPPAMRLWLGGPAESYDLHIHTFESFLLEPTSGKQRTYQIEVEDSLVTFVASGPFKVTYLSVIIPHDTERGLGDPTVQTEQEEVGSDYSTSELIEQRSYEVGKKIREVLDALLYFKQASELCD
jgi:hypothetical protein